MPSTNGLVSAVVKKRKTFERLARSGATVMQIVRALGAGKRQVRQALADSPELRPEWRRPPTDAKSPMARNVLGKMNPAWRGGRMTDKSGYVLIYMPDHPQANRHGQVREHRLVMERHLGRILDRREVVHHKNGNPADNRIRNLKLFASNGLHLKETTSGVPCPARANRYS